MKLVSRLDLMCVATIAALACGDSPTEPPASVSGSYTAVKLTVETGGDVVDMLAEGTELSLVLASDGTTSGTLVIPAAYSESGLEETLALDGTYEYDRNGMASVRFEMEADTFIRDILWLVQGRDLNGHLVSGDVSIAAVLRR